MEKILKFVIGFTASYYIVKVISWIGRKLHQLEVTVFEDPEKALTFVEGFVNFIAVLPFAGLAILMISVVLYSIIYGSFYIGEFIYSELS